MIQLVLMKKPKILLLFTGGTVAMIKDAKTGVLVPAKTPRDILKLAPELDSHFNIDYQFIANLDSSNMVPFHWAQIAEVIYKQYAKYDGFVITHGSDTMSYTASAVSFALDNLGKPVVFTGSQLPPDALGSDARNNLVNAFRVATMDIGEVVVVFGQRILRANRSSKISESAFDAFWSPIYADLGRIRLEIELFDHHMKRDKKKRPVLNAQFCEEIFVFTITPGIKATYLNVLIDNGVKGIILDGFGPGNLPINDKDFMDAIKKAIKKNIPIIIGSQCSAGVARIFIYETGRIAAEIGGISAEDMTLEATVTKLMWILAQTKDMKKVKKLMKTNIAGEINS